MTINHKPNTVNCQYAAGKLTSDPASRVMTPMHGINLSNPIYFAKEQFTTDLALNADSWRYFAGETVDKADKDANGYWITPQYEPYVYISQLEWMGDNDVKDYVLIHNGADDNNLEIFGTAVINTTSTAPGKIYFTVVTPGQLKLRVRNFNATQPITDLKIIPASEEGNNSMPLVNARWREIWDGFGVIRHLDTQGINGSIESANLKSDSAWGGYKYSIGKIVQAHNETQTDLWFLIPHLATDAWIQAAAEYIYANLDKNLKVYIEYTNEPWNTGFEQSQWLLRQAVGDVYYDANYPTFTAGDWQAWLEEYGIRAAPALSKFRQYFPDWGRLTRVYNSQFWNFGRTEGVEHVVDFANDFDAIALGYYIGNNHKTSNIGTKTTDDIIDEMIAEVNGGAVTQLRKYRDFCNKHQLVMIAYEAGQHLASSDTSTQTFFDQVNANPRMKDVYLAMNEQWKAHGGKTICWFNSAYQVFGVLTHQGADLSTSHKYQALQQMLSDERVPTPNKI